ncbi:MAG: hypothetical protein ACK4Y7_04255 [Caldimicrobium sp.]
MKYRWIEHLTQAWDLFLEDLFSFVPEQSKVHLKNAKKELLLAMKSAIEEKIAQIEKTEKKEIKKVKVERAEG